MGMSWSDYLGIGLQGVGAVAGGIFGGPAGAGTGAGLGGAIAGGLSLLDKSKQVKMPGMTPEQEKALFYQGQIASKAMAQDGISSQTASRVTQAGRETALSDIAEANTFGRRLSPLDRAMLVKQLTERSQKTQSQLMDNLMAYAEGRETQALGIAGQASKNLMDSATEMERDRTLKFEKELKARQAQFEQYTKSISALAGTLTNTLFDTNKKPTAPAVQGTQPLPEGVMEYAGIGSSLGKLTPSLMDRKPDAEPIEYAGMKSPTGMNPSLAGSLIPETQNQEALEWGGMGNPFEQLSLLLNLGR